MKTVSMSPKESKTNSATPRAKLSFLHWSTLLTSSKVVEMLPLDVLPNAEMSTPASTVMSLPL